MSTGLPGVNGQLAVTRVVVSEHGFTLYHFSKDRRNSGKSACYGKCEKLWRPYLTLGKPTVINRAQQPLVGTIKRRDGSLQVTYAGFPMYSYAPDPPAAAEGAGRRSFGGAWLLISRGGKVIASGGTDTTAEETAATGASAVGGNEIARAVGKGVFIGSPVGRPGRIVVNRFGRALYALSKDKQNSGKSACYRKCERVWVPYQPIGTTKVAKTPEGALLGTITRKDGLTRQMTYNGWPLYEHGALASKRFRRRHSFGGVVYLIDPSGKVIP